MVAYGTNKPGDLPKVMPKIAPVTDEGDGSDDEPTDEGLGELLSDKPVEGVGELVKGWWKHGPTRDQGS